MKDETKEILDKCTPFLFGDEVDKLTNYITNLQQENQDIKDTLQDKLDYIGHLKELCDKYNMECATVNFTYDVIIDKINPKKAFEKFRSNGERAKGYIENAFDDSKDEEP